MRRRTLLALLASVSLSATADPVFWDQAVDLLNSGKVEEAGLLAKAVLDAQPNDADALVIAGTQVLYSQLKPRREDSIFTPEVDLKAEGEPRLSPEAVEAVATYWSKVPGQDPERAYLWGDLAQMTFRAGDSGRALEYAAKVLATPSSDADSLRSAASVFVLNLDWARATQALTKIPGERVALLYQGLELWRTGKDGWRVPLKSFVENPGPQKAGSVLAAYLIGPAMRDTEGGYLEALKVEEGIAALAVRQKYVERYPDKFQPRLDLARNLCQFGSFTKALGHFSEIDRKAIATTAEQRQSVLFQQAWAHQAAGHQAEAVRLWALLTESKDFYIRSAADWFLGHQALTQGKKEEARAWWARVADEPARSKYAYWCAAELKKLPQ